MDVSVFAGAKAKPDEVVIPFAGAIGGVVQIIADKPYSFSEGDLDIARLITNQVGFMLDNRYLLAETEAAKEEAEKASRIKSQFLANMSHELRTPLNAILNFTGFVVDGDVGEINEEQEGLLSKVYQSGEHLLNLINDILDLSKIEADMMQFLIEDVDLGQVLTSTASVAKGLLKGKTVEFIADIDEELPIIFGDKRRLRQVFLNIIANAIKFTPEGNVTLKAAKENGDIHVSIADTGIGIAPDAYGIVFEAFGQAKHDMEVSGTGLGMAISKHFIEAHGGQIWFESEIGVGTTFHITLPVNAQNEQSGVA
jgi:signal transduction histidine kinase